MNNSISISWQKIILVLAVVICGLLGPAYCETGGPVLLLQQTPANGGTINPRAGVHNFEQNASVTLQAIPQAGYHFVYWLGDVSDPTSNRTTVYLDAPKIVVAVFERTVYEIEEVLAMATSLPGGFGGGLFAGAADYSRRGGGGGGGGGDEPRKPKPPPPELPELSPEVPVPVPEPATVVLLAVGGFLAFAGRRPKKLTCMKTGDKTLK
ncbi:MAG TPA: PEP-CTERM sorting domain-containing protein [Sedimentisphaerales bacterium]|nr:PEP-CTERM sorting domain-containing protein [Sedimentisphaerales bacterium]